MTKQQQKLWNVLYFLVRFLILAIPLHLIIWSSYDFSLLKNITSSLLELMLKILNVSYIRDGLLFTISTKTGMLIIEIIRDCVGWKSMLAFASLIVAVPKIKLRKRLYGILIGVPIIFVMNAFRLATTFYISSIFGVEVFDFVHKFLWQVGLIVLILAMWVFWLKKIGDGTGR